MENIVLTIHLIIALCLIGIVLVQRSEGGGLGIGGGGGGGAMSGRPSVTPLGKLTWAFGVAFLITSITLTVLASNSGSNSSVLDDAELLPPSESTTPPADALLPPVQGDAPLAPPRADE